MTKTELIAAAKISARLAGCLCEPNIQLYEHAPQVYSSHVEHDSWCPLVSGKEKPRHALIIQ